MGRTGPLDQAVFTELFEAHVGFVQYVAQRAGWKGNSADDVVQETFLRLYQHPPESLAEKAVRAWLATTARRVIVDIARKTRREHVSDKATDEGIAGPLWFQDSESMERELEILAVREMVDQISALPGGEDFRAFYVDGLKAREIAEKRGEAISTITSRISKLRARFRDQLKTRLQQIGARRA